MERFNGEFRDWEQPFRGLKDPDSSLIPGFAVFFNMIKEHSTLGGKTLGEVAKILIEGENKWITQFRTRCCTRFIPQRDGTWTNFTDFNPKFRA